MLKYKHGTFWSDLSGDQRDQNQTTFLPNDPKSGVFGISLKSITKIIFENVNLAQVFTMLVAQKFSALFGSTKKKCANYLCSSCSNGTKITTVDRKIRCRLPVGWIFKVCGPNRASIHYHGIRLIFTKRCLIGQAEVVIYNFIHLMFIGKENAWVCRPVDRKLTLCKKTPTRNIKSTSFLINVQNIITGIK